MISASSTIYLASHLDDHEATGKRAHNCFCFCEKDEIAALLATTPEHGVALANITLPGLGATAAFILFARKGNSFHRATCDA